MIKYFSTYFAKTKTYGIGRFIIELTFVGFLAKILPALLLGITLMILAGAFGIELPVFEEDVERGFRDNYLQAFLLGVLVAPPIETIIGQWMPIWFLQRFTQKTTILLIGATAFFVVLHHPARYVSALAMGLVLSWSFLVWRKRSKKHAYFITTAIHMLHNFLISLLQYFLPT